MAEFAINHRDIAATLGFVSKTPRCPNFFLRLNVKRLCVLKLNIASSARNRAEHDWLHSALTTGESSNGRVAQVCRV